MMKKYSKGIIGVFILLVIGIVFLSGYKLLTSVEKVNVSKNLNLTKTTDGATCNNDEEMNDEYSPTVSFSNGLATIKVAKGSFRVTNVINGQYLTNDPMTLGTVTPDHPMTITYNTNVSGDVSLHFVLTETDDLCLSYDEAPLNSEGQKAGTYEFDMTLQLKPQLETPLKNNMKIIKMHLKLLALVKMI